MTSTDSLHKSNNCVYVPRIGAATGSGAQPLLVESNVNLDIWICQQRCPNLDFRTAAPCFLHPSTRLHTWKHQRSTPRDPQSSEDRCQENMKKVRRHKQKWNQFLSPDQDSQETFGYIQKIGHAFHRCEPWLVCMDKRYNCGLGGRRILWLQRPCLGLILRLLFTYFAATLPIS